MTVYMESEGLQIVDSEVMLDPGVEVRSVEGDSCLSVLPQLFMTQYAGAREGSLSLAAWQVPFYVFEICQ